MPIYAYKCTACGHAEDVLQKISDNRLTDCPACKKSTYEKQVTAAGFQLKGSGWYVTDFRNNAGGTSKTSEAAVGKTAAEAASDSASGSGSEGAGASAAATGAASSASSSDSSGTSSGNSSSTSTSAPASSPASTSSQTSKSATSSTTP